MLNKQKSYGNKYNTVKIKVKLNKRKLLKFLILFLIICEIVLGVLLCLKH